MRLLSNEEMACIAGAGSAEEGYWDDGFSCKMAQTSSSDVWVSTAPSFWEQNATVLGQNAMMEADANAGMAQITAPYTTACVVGAISNDLKGAVEGKITPVQLGVGAAAGCVGAVTAYALNNALK